MMGLQTGLSLLHSLDCLQKKVSLLVGTDYNFTRQVALDGRLSVLTERQSAQGWWALHQINLLCM